MSVNVFWNGWFEVFDRAGNEVDSERVLVVRHEHQGEVLSVALHVQGGDLMSLTAANALALGRALIDAASPSTLAPLDPREAWETGPDRFRIRIHGEGGRDIEVEGFSVGEFLGVHRSFDGSQWKLTHRPTGLSMAAFSSLVVALGGAEKLHAEHTSGRLNLDFTDPEQGKPGVQPQLRAFVRSLPGLVTAHGCAIVERDGGAS
ncbi:MAG: hypothetical protein IT454_19175 [Planctomycetes bacterium]|nr:hypothetical protein [Planctomycetota bacterium]